MAIPMRSQMTRAIHSAWEKCPGNFGMSFMATRSNATMAPIAATSRGPARVSTRKNEIHAANQPEAQAIEPTSVTGTRSESPRTRPATGAMVTPAMRREFLAGFVGSFGNRFESRHEVRNDLQHQQYRNQRRRGEPRMKIAG